MAYTRIHKGPLFRDFIKKIILTKRARSYLEVGVRDGATLCNIPCTSIGVDPMFNFTLNPVGDKKLLYLFQMTSDEFFRDIDVKNIINGPIDVVFLDGLHQFEFLLRDFINSEALCCKNSLIMLDDCLPVNSEMTERYHNVADRKNTDLAQWWTGDVWKLVPILTEYRPDLRITPVDTSPTGNVCITNLDPNSNILQENYYKILDRYKNVVMNDEMIEDFYNTYQVVLAETVLYGFDYSLIIGS